MSTAELREEAFGSAGSAPVWYHGSMSRGVAEGKLVGTPEGTYVVRDSSSNPGDYVLSTSEDGRVSHYIIQRQAKNQYFIGEQQFGDLVQILEFYKRHILDCSTLSVPLPMEGQVQNGVLASEFYCTVKALFNFNAKDPEDLSFRKGELLNVLQKHEKQWWKAQSQRTLQIGCIPVNYVEDINKKEEAPPPPPLGDRKPLKRSESVKEPVPALPPARGRKAALPAPPAVAEPVRAAAPALPAARRARAPSPPPEAVKPAAPALQPRKPIANPNVQPYIPKIDTTAEELPDRPKFIAARAILDRVANAYDSTALSFKVGDILQVTKQHENGLWHGSIVNGDGKVGHFPFTLVELIDTAEYDDDLASMETVFTQAMDEIYGCL